MDALNVNITPHLRSGVRLLPAAHGRLDASALLGLGLAAESNVDARKSHHDDEEHDHDDFDSFAVELGDVADSDLLEQRLVQLVATHDILRVKGFLNRPGRDRREVIQGVGPRFQRYFDRDWRADEPRRSQLVIIGMTGLDRHAITVALGAA